VPVLTIQLFGAPQVAVDDRPLITDTRKAIALLAYLAVTRQPQTRDALATLLWPELNQSKARGALRRTLSALNAGGPLPWLRVEREQVTLLCDDGVFCDVHRFEHCVVACPPDDRAPCATCRPLLEEAAGLYHGDFLAGFTLRDSAAFDDWQFFQAESYRNTLARVLEALVRCATAAHDWPAAIAHARRHLALDPLHEPAHRQLMLLYAWDNQRAAALRQYQECARILDAELGVPPLEETTALYTAVLHHQTPPTAVPAPAAEMSRAPEVIAPPLVGREHEWATLQAAYQTASERGRLVVIEGEAGVGKSALANAFAEAQVRQGAPLLAAVGYPGEATLAYAPLAMLFQRAAAEPNLRARLAALDPTILAEVGRLQPALLALTNGGPAAPPDPVAAQSRFFAGLAQAIFALLAGSPPGILLLDDIHCADSATLDWLTYFARRLGAQRVCVVLVWRADETPAGHRLRQLVAESARQGAAAVIELGRLSSAAVARWVAQALPARSAEDHTLAERLYAETEGLPFFVAEYLHMLARRGADDSPAAWRAPSSVREFLYARLAPVTEVARQVLAAGAVIGRSFQVDAVTAASGRSDEEALAALEELLALRLVVEADGDRLDFAHTQLRQVVYDDLTHLRRRLLHRRVADALATAARRTGGEENAAGVLTHHYQLGGEQAKAAHFAFVAGEQARRVYANRAASAYFEAALALGAPAASAAHAHLGDLYTLSGEYGRAAQAYTSALALATADQRAELEQRYGRLCERLGDAVAAEHHFAAADQLLPPGATGARAHLLTDWSLTLARTHDIPAAIRLATAGLAAAADAGDHAALARAHTLLALLARRQGNLAQALAAAEAGLAAARSQPDPGILAAALNSLALAHTDNGAPAAAIPLVEEALAEVVRMGDRHREAALRNTLADLHHSCGQDNQAMAQLKQAVVIFAEIGGEAGGENAEIWMLREW
jgi:predicted ATPase/DNA-binding SARP family transcriptional activator